MHYSTKRNYDLNQRVIISDTFGEPLGGSTGYILGKSFIDVFDVYIVMLDKPLDFALAVCLPEAMLDAI